MPHDRLWKPRPQTHVLRTEHAHAATSQRSLKQSAPGAAAHSVDTAQDSRGQPQPSMPAPQLLGDHYSTARQRLLRSPWTRAACSIACFFQQLTPPAPGGLWPRQRLRWLQAIMWRLVAPSGPQCRHQAALHRAEPGPLRQKPYADVGVHGGQEKFSTQPQQSRGNRLPTLCAAKHVLVALGQPSPRLRSHGQHFCAAQPRLQQR